MIYLFLIDTATETIWETKVRPALIGWARKSPRRRFTLLLKLIHFCKLQVHPCCMDRAGAGRWCVTN